MHRLGVLLAAAMLVAPTPQAWAGQESAPAPEGPLAFGDRYYASQDVDVPMRDGVVLKTRILRPRRAGPDLPFLLLRTPYGLASEAMPARMARFATMARSGYIFVIQEMRGTAGSGGDFVLVPPRAATSGRSDEATDASDTVDWLLAHVAFNNGRVGVTGCSYGGYSSVMAALSGNPAIRAVSPQAAMADLFRGDDIYWNGIPLLAQSPFFLTLMDSRMKSVARLPMADAYEWYRDAGALRDVQGKAFDLPSPSWQHALENDRQSAFWRSRALDREAAAIKVPMLNVMGWYDVEDFAGPMRLFKAVDAHDTTGTNRAAIGPWRHCDWLAPRPGDELGPLSFGEPTAEQFRDDIEARFFAYYLKDEGSLATMPQVMAFETGGGGWKGYATWPPSSPERTLFLDAGRQLSWSAASPGIDSYVSDPANPVPYARRPIGFFTGRGLETDVDHERARSLFIVEDQRFAQDRPDVLTWKSQPLDRDMILTGGGVLELFAETSGTDVDWIAQLIDLHPEGNDPRWSGYRLPVTRGALRASLQQGLDAPRAVRPGHAGRYRIEFLDRNHRFRKGHRIMLQLQSSWFPYLARNPQRFVPATAATSEDFTMVTNRIHRGDAHPSRLLLPLSPAGAGNGSWQPGDDR